MVIQVGDRVPAAPLQCLFEGQQKYVSNDKLLENRKVVLFSVPGAFTKKSTTLHIPDYLRHADQILAKGVDEIICVGPNDAFVMEAWGAHCGVGDKIRMLADAQCEFFTALGLELDLTRLGIGFRCERFSMIIDSGIVSNLNIEEPNEDKVSGADTILSQLG